jgi:tetratricopeptide (TPR) repeat protein
MDYGRPLTPEQIEDERKTLIDLVTKLEKEGKITVRKKRKGGILDGEEAADDTETLQLVSTKGEAKKEEPVDPVKAQESFQMGAALLEQGRYADAVPYFHAAIQHQNTLWQAYQYLGGAYAAQGMVPQAAGAYERMVEINPDEALKAWVMQWKASVGLSTQAQAV